MNARLEPRPWWRHGGYHLFKCWLAIMAIVFFRFRCRGRRSVPPTGSVLVCSNHQSFFDPVLVGICFRPQMGYLARATLFRFPVFGWIIRYLDAIPIDKEGMGIAGIKEMLRRLRRGEIVHLFPEGTRSIDGHLQALQPGFIALARRGKCQILPMAVSGAHEAWPRSAKVPRWAPLISQIGTPMTVQEIADLDDEQLIAEVHRRITQCLNEARRRRPDEWAC